MVKILVIRIPFESDRPSRFHVGNDIGAASHRHIQGRFIELMGGIVLFRYHRKLPHDERELGVGPFPEDEFHRPVSHLLRLQDVGVVRPVEGMSLLHQRLKGEYHVVDGDR